MNNNVKFLTVTSVRRLNNSTMGNPAFEFTFTNGTVARTKANTMFAGEVVNDGRYDGKSYNVTFTRAGRITDMRRAEKSGNPAESGMEFIGNRWVFTGRKHDIVAYAANPSTEYTCHYLNEAGETVRAIYHVYREDGIHQAMAIHNAAKPEAADRVVKWISPEGITFHTHDSKVTL